MLARTIGGVVGAAGALTALHKLAPNVSPVLKGLSAIPVVAGGYAVGTTPVLLAQDKMRSRKLKEKGFKRSETGKINHIPGEYLNKNGSMFDPLKKYIKGKGDETFGRIEKKRNIIREEREMEPVQLQKNGYVDPNERYKNMPDAVKLKYQQLLEEELREDFQLQKERAARGERQTKEEYRDSIKGSVVAGYLGGALLGGIGGTLATPFKRYSKRLRGVPLVGAGVFGGAALGATTLPIVRAFQGRKDIQDPGNIEEDFDMRELKENQQELENRMSKKAALNLYSKLDSFTKEAVS
jgi:hypothetical protein